VFAATLRRFDCIARVQWRWTLVPRAALALALALLVGRFAVTPVMADLNSDWSLCWTFGTNKSKEKIAACTLVINSKRLSGDNLAIAYQQRAEGYRLLEQYDRALEDFARAIKIGPRLAYNYLNRAEIHRLKKNYDKVVEDASQAIRLDPDLNASYTIRGLAYENMKNVSAARADYNKTLSIPVKGNDGPGAQDVARTRLKEIGN